MRGDMGTGVGGGWSDLLVRGGFSLWYLVFILFPHCFISHFWEGWRGEGQPGIWVLWTREESRRIDIYGASVLDWVLVLLGIRFCRGVRGDGFGWMAPRISVQFRLLDFGGYRSFTSLSRYCANLI